MGPSRRTLVYRLGLCSAVAAALSLQAGCYQWVAISHREVGSGSRNIRGDTLLLRNWEEEHVVRVTHVEYPYVDAVEKSSGREGRTNLREWDTILVEELDGTTTLWTVLAAVLGPPLLGFVLIYAVTGGGPS